MSLYIPLSHGIPRQEILRDAVGGSIGFRTVSGVFIPKATLDTNWQSAAEHGKAIRFNGAGDLTS